MRSAAITTLFVLGLTLPARTSAAQETVNYASLAGRLTDPQGAVVAGAQVAVVQAETNVTAEATSDAEGRFRFPYLKVGPYVITVRAAGFRTVTRPLTLTIGSAFDISISLTVAAVETTVDVTAAAPVVEAARTQIAATVSGREVSDLPINGRSFLDVALLAPGVSPTNVASTQLFAETSAVPGPGLSVGSQRNFSNSFIVDGLSANDDAAGLSGMALGLDAVDQLQVVTSGAQAELGRALGGYINVVTKSGTNRARGDLYGYLRDDRLNAANPLTGTTLPMNQKQYGASLGGPIRPSRTFFFGNVEARRLNQTGLTTIGAENVDAINDRLSAVGYPGPLIATGTYPNPVHTVNFLAKVDHEPSGGERLGVRYGLYKVTSENSRGAGALNATSASSALDSLDQSVAISNTLTLTSRTVNETRAQVTYSDLTAPPTDPIGPAVTIQGVASFGTLSGSPTARVNRLFEVVDNLSHQAGEHNVRAGVDFLFNSSAITFPRSVRGAYTFSSLPAFLSGTYNNAGFAQTFGDTRVSQANPNVGIYAQDEWKVGSNVTLNGGLRYDLQFLETIHTDTNNVSPRIGLAWAPHGSDRTVVRGSAGLYYDRVPLRALANALLSAGNTTDVANLRQISLTLSPGQAGAPAFPALLAAPVPAVTLPNVTTMSPNMQNAFSRQASVEVEHAIGNGRSVSIGYQYTRGVDLIISINQNVPSCIASGTNNGCRPNPAFANNTQYTPAAASAYHGLHVSYLQRPAPWGYVRVSYTLSKAMDNVGEFFFSSPIDPFDLSKDWGRSDDDQRHRLVVNGALSSSTAPASTWWEQLTHGFQVSGAIEYYSSLPLNITSGATTIQGTAGRPVVNGAFIGRNVGLGPDFFVVNLRLSRSFKVVGRTEVEGLVEGFNVTNRRNVVTINGNFGSDTYPTSPAPTFGQITGVGDPRAVQIALRARF